MSINVNNLSKADLVKLAMKSQSGKTAAANQPSYMTKNGSIFNAPNAKQTTQTKDAKPTTVSEGIEKLKNSQAQETGEKKLYEDIDSIKTAKEGREAINQLKQDMNGANLLERMKLQKQLNKLEEKQKQLVEQEFKQSQENLKSIARGDGAITNDGNAGSGKSSSVDGQDVSADEGKAMANDAEQDNKKAEQDTASVQKDGQQVESYQKDAKKTQKDVKKDEAKFNKEIAKESKAIAKNQAEMAKEAETMAQTKTEIDALQSELQSLTADSTGIGENSAFSLKLAGEQSTGQSNGASSSDETATRMEELQNQIGIKADSMQASGQKLQKLQTSTNKSITVMHNKVRLKSIYYQKAQKTMETQQKTTDKILDGAQKFDDAMQVVQQTGKTLQYVGKGMMIAGKALASNPFTAAAGAALISAGGFTQKAGTVTEMVGQYGSAAANVVKTACHVADGNFAAALQTAGSAIQSGAAALKTTQGLDKQMDAIDSQVEQAQTEAAASVQAKEMAKELKESGKLDEMGMTQKQASSTIKGNIMNDVNSGKLEYKDGQFQRTLPDVKMDENGKLVTSYKNAGQMSGTHSSVLKGGTTDSTIVESHSGSLGGAAKAGENMSFGEKIKNGVKSGFASAKEGIKKAAKDPDTLMKIGKQMTTLGASMAQRSQQAGRKQTGSKNYSYPQYNINYDRLERGQNMMKKIRNRSVA